MCDYDENRIKDNILKMMEEMELRDYADNQPKRTAEDILAEDQARRDMAESEFLGEIEEAFPGQGFQITGAENQEAQNHTIIAEHLENEMLCMSIMGYTKEALEGVGVALSEARRNAQEAGREE